MRIDPLIRHPAAMPLVARWHHEAFGALNPARTLGQREQWLRDALDGEALPLTLLALAADGTPAGCASLTTGTLTHGHRGPWLSMVYVQPEHRRMGVASALAQRAAAECARLGYAKLFLFTPHHERLYARLGWRTFDHATVGPLRAAVMERGVQWS
jgi:GNAT superfamily N-acetyltransferase